MELSDLVSPAVGKLITSREWLAPNTLTNLVAERFFESAKREAIALVECGEPVALVTRPKLLFTLFRRYGFELYGKKPVILIADPEPLIINEAERLDVAIEMALDRPPEDIYDDIVVVDDHGYYKGLLSVKQLIIQQSNALANSIIQKELAHERAKELERLNALKSQFIAHVTHELRSPVNAIMGLAELMRISAEKGYIDQLKDRLSLLMSSAANLKAVINNILDLAKIEAGKMEVFIEEFDLLSLMREVIETTRVLLGNKPVEVILLSSYSTLILESDPVKVRQILINLTSNAAKFTERGRITLSLLKEDGHVKIQVSDTGIGIKKEDLQKLFTAFSQLEDVKTRRYEGTGLGLTITKNLVDLLGGKISVSSKYGEGTTFEVLLPLIYKKEEYYGT